MVRLFTQNPLVLVTIASMATCVFIFEDVLYFLLFYTLGAGTVWMDVLVEFSARYKFTTVRCKNEVATVSLIPKCRKWHARCGYRF